MIEINKEIISIWRKHGKTGQDLSPLLYRPIQEKGGFLCVGINPSFSKSVFKKITDENFNTIVEKHRFKNIDKYKQYLIDTEENAWKKLPYFNKTKRNCFNAWFKLQHLDLFYERETEQKSLEKKYFHKNKMIDFCTRTV